VSTIVADGTEGVLSTLVANGTVTVSTIVANGTEVVLSTLVANGTGTVSTIVANGSERVNRKHDRSGIIDSCRLHTVHPTAKTNKFEDFGLISVFSRSSLYLLSKSILSNRFATLFTHSQLLTQVFIFTGNTGKSSCNGTFTIYIAANKEYLKKDKLF